MIRSLQESVSDLEKRLLEKEGRVKELELQFYKKQGELEAA